MTPNIPNILPGHYISAKCGSTWVQGVFVEDYLDGTILVIGEGENFKCYGPDNTYLTRVTIPTTRDHVRKVCVDYGLPLTLNDE